METAATKRREQNYCLGPYLSIARRQSHVFCLNSTNPRSPNLSGSTELCIKQQTYADKLRCSRSTIGRTLRELIKAEHGPHWKQKFPKLDGDSGRPYLESCVDQAILGMAQIGITRDPPSFVENWLRIATEKYCLPLPKP